MREASSNEHLENTTFSTALRGYDRDEVDAFVRTVAQEMRALNEDRNEKVYESLGEEMGALLQHARDSADAMKRQAQEDAANTRAEAEAEANKIKEDATAAARELQQTAEQHATKTRTEAESEASTRIADATEKVRRLEATEGQARARLKSIREELASITNDLLLLDEEPEDQTAPEEAENAAEPSTDGESTVQPTSVGELDPAESAVADTEDDENTRLEPQRSSIR